MKQRTLRVATVCVACVLAVLALAGCQAQSKADQSPAAQNRQYMASLNQQMEDLQTDMTAFQTAVAEKDTVTMQAQLASVEKTIEEVKNSEATERLQSVKDQYVDALTQLNEALVGYVDLYEGVSKGSVSDEQYNQKLSDIQSTYDSALEALKSADEAVVDIASE